MVSFFFLFGGHAEAETTEGVAKAVAVLISAYRGGGTDAGPWRISSEKHEICR